MDPDLTGDFELVKATDSEGNSCVLQKDVLIQQLLAI
jgi:hypothetical protein